MLMDHDPCRLLGLMQGGLLDEWRTGILESTGALLAGCVIKKAASASGLLLKVDYLLLHAMIMKLEQIRRRDYGHVDQEEQAELDH